MNVPEPTTAKLVDKKTAAYEKQQAEVEEESRMKSLEQLAGTLMNEGKGASDTGEKEKDGDRLQQSVNTYEQISGQLNDFYETPKETANSDLERKVDELNKKLEEAEKEKNKAATREELMERSYKMAAKYLNPDKDTVQEKAVGKEPTETVPVQRAEYQTTSGLSQPVTDSAYIASLTVERNYGFNTAVGNSYQMGTNTIAACISENQIIEQGGRVKLRLLQPLQAGNITVPENSLVTGAAVIQGERLDPDQQHRVCREYHSCSVGDLRYRRAERYFRSRIGNPQCGKGCGWNGQREHGKQRFVCTFCRTAGGHGPDARSHAGRHAVDRRTGSRGQGDTESRI